MKLDYPNVNENLKWFSYDDKELEKYVDKIMI